MSSYCGMHARVDDGHVQAGPDRVVQEDGVDRLADAVVAAERERDVGHAAADPHVGERRLEAPGGLEEGDRVVRVLLDAGGDREDVGVEDDVRVARSPPARVSSRWARGEDLDPALHRVGLAVLVEGHHHGRRAVPPAQPRLAQELLLALLEADRVDDAAALELPQPGLEHGPPGAVHHDRHGGDVGLRGEPAQEAGHGGDAVEHRLVHVHVEDHGAVHDLVAGDRDGLVLARAVLAQGAGHQPRELARAR